MNFVIHFKNQTVYICLGSHIPKGDPVFCPIDPFPQVILAIDPLYLPMPNKFGTFALTVCLKLENVMTHSVNLVLDALFS